MDVIINGRGPIEWRRVFSRLRQVLHSRSNAAWQCAARHSTPDSPAYADCDWPMCDCDPKAVDVIAALQERGLVAAPPAALTDDARDAARYRWLRDAQMPDIQRDTIMRLSANALDAVVDAAIDAAVRGKP